MRTTILSILLTATAFYAAAKQPYTNVQVNERVNNPEETSIGINPLDPEHIVGVAQYPCHFYYSFNSGVSWDEGDLPDPYDLGDPAITFDRLGHVYYCYIGLFSHSGIFINRSDDGGVTWWPAATAVVEHNGSVPFEDKSYPACDWTDSPHSGNLYVAWTRFSHYGSSDPADSSWIYFARSTDRAESFSEPLKICDRGGNAIDSDATVEGAVPAIGPDGTVYVAWSGPRGIEFDRSTDGGITFGTDRVISDQPGGWAFDIPGISRANGFPVTKTDISYGPYRGRVYVNWSDQRNGDTDVFLIYSDDGGETWGPRVRVNDDQAGNGIDQFFNWIDVDPVTGVVYVVFYDRRAYPPGSTATDFYLAISENGGQSFTNVLISELSFDPDAGVFFGDYVGISAFAGRVRPLWMKLDTTILSIWTALIDLPNAGSDEDGIFRARLRIAPNPLRTGAQITAQGLTNGPGLLNIHDIQGRLIRSLDAGNCPPGVLSTWWNGRNVEGRFVSQGSYFVSGSGLAPTRIVVLR